jgi:nucleoside 2-deoxyribosyltransferase
MHVYIAGPLFNEGERWFNEQIDQRVRAAGHTSFLPHRDGGVGLKTAEDVPLIFNEDVTHLDKANIVVANLNGVTSDDGAAWELGYAYARGKHLVGVYTDSRLHFPYQVVNLMIQCSLHRLVRSLDELEDYLRQL